MIGGAGMNSQAYQGPNYRTGPYDRQAPYGRQGRYGHRVDPAVVVQRVISDLHVAARNSFTDRHEHGHFATAVSELQRFQDRWARQRRIEAGHLDRAIDHMKHLAEARQVHPRARRMIDQDIEDLRDLRAQLRWYRD